MNIYDFTFSDSRGHMMGMASYKGKVILIANTATQGGLAKPFEELERLHQAYKDEGLVVLGFPCDQFPQPAPESNGAMVDAGKVNFGVTFLLSEKIDVNGGKAHPLFVFLKKQLPGSLLGSGIKGNFTNFLVSRKGKPTKRYAPVAKPAELEEDIVKLLRNG